MLTASRLRLLAHLESLGTVRAVGLALHLSPSAVSAQLAALETEVGAPLLERNGRRVRLTPAGRVLAQHARTILDQMAVARADVAGLGSGPVGPVRVAAFSSAVRALVVPLAGRLRDEHPGVELEVLELDPRESGPALRRGEVDLAVTADFVDGSVPLDGEVVTVPLLEDAIVLVVSRRRERAPGSEVDVTELADDWWASDLPGTYLSNLVASTCRRAGFEPRVAARLPSYDLMLAHVEADLSVALLPELAVDLRYDVTVHPVRPRLTRPVHVALRRGAPLTAAAQVVLDRLRTVSDGAGIHPPRSTAGATTRSATS